MRDYPEMVEEIKDILNTCAIASNQLRKIINLLKREGCLPKSVKDGIVPNEPYKYERS